MLNTVLNVLHWLAALVVLLEAFNKLERTDPLRAGLDAGQRLVAMLKATAWVCLALGAAGWVARPAVVAAGQAGARVGSMLVLDPPSLVDLFYAIGFAVLIVRSRVKEHVRDAPA